MNRFCLDFNALNAKQMYDILALRSIVFVVEQNCVYHDPDNKDFHANHLLYYNDGAQLIAYARLLPPGISFPEASIGRVVVSQAYRGTQLGRKLMVDAIATCQSLWPDYGITIGAQTYLQQFYTSLGFYNISEEYLEDGIPHRDMRFNNKE